MQKFSVGDWIALGAAMLVFVRWLWEMGSHKIEVSTTHQDQEEAKLVQLRSDFDAHQASDRTEFRWIKEALTRVERKVDNLQRQMAFVAIGANDRILHSEGSDEPE